MDKLEEELDQIVGEHEEKLMPLIAREGELMQELANVKHQMIQADKEMKRRKEETLRRHRKQAEDIIERIDEIGVEINPNAVKVLPKHIIKDSSPPSNYVPPEKRSSANPR